MTAQLEKAPVLVGGLSELLVLVKCRKVFPVGDELGHDPLLSRAPLRALVSCLGIWRDKNLAWQIWRDTTRRGPNLDFRPAWLAPVITGEVCRCTSRLVHKTVA